MSLRSTLWTNLQIISLFSNHEDFGRCIRILLIGSQCTAPRPLFIHYSDSQFNLNRALSQFLSDKDICIHWENAAKMWIVLACKCIYKDDEKKSNYKVVLKSSLKCMWRHPPPFLKFFIQTLPKAQGTQGNEYFDSFNNSISKQKL